MPLYLQSSYLPTCKDLQEVHTNCLLPPSQLVGDHSETSKSQHELVMLYWKEARVLGLMSGHCRSLLPSTV